MQGDNGTVHLIVKKNMKTTAFLSLLPIACGMAIPSQDDEWQFADSRWLMWNFDYIGDPVAGDFLYFNLTSDPTASEPTISVECEIWRKQPYWQPCSMLIANSADWNRGVWVLPLPTTDTINFRIMHAFTNASVDPHTYYNLVR